MKYGNLITQLKGLTKDEVLSRLTLENKLTNQDRNLIYSYLFPRPLLHMELPSRILKAREEEFKLGYLEKNLPETTLLLEAYKGPQYNRYLKHLMYSFDDVSKVFSVAGTKNHECGICKKPIYELADWMFKFKNDEVEMKNKQQLAFSSTESKICLCINCLTQLKYLDELLDEIEPSRFKPTKGEGKDLKT